MAESSTKEIFDAFTGSSRDGCDPDWCAEVLERASPDDIERVKSALSNRTESEAASNLGVMD